MATVRTTLSTKNHISYFGCCNFKVQKMELKMPSYTNWIFALLLSLFSFNSFAGTCTPIPAGASVGQTLYCQNCATCHGEPPAIDGRASRGANSGSTISSALNNVGAMQFLKGNFSATQINSIATFIGNPVSGGGGSGTITPAFNAADLWWNPNESGWGLTVTQHANSSVLVVVIYTYMSTGQPLWLISSGSWTTPTSFVGGDLSQFTGPPFNANPFPTTAVGTKVGTLSLTMINNDNATLTYSVNGVTVTKAVTRFAF
jgi:mono/diheme cytochrome c family protein